MSGIIKVDYANIGGGARNYYEADVTVANGGTVVNCGFKPKTITATCALYYNNYYYAGMYQYDEDNSKNTYCYKIATATGSFNVYNEAKISNITDTGFTIDVFNSVWAGTVAHIVAVD